MNISELRKNTANVFNQVANGTPVVVVRGGIEFIIIRKNDLPETK